MEPLIGTMVALVSFVGGIITTIFYVGVRRGKDQTVQITLTNQVKGLEDEMQTVIANVAVISQTQALQELRLARVEDDHRSMINLVEKLTGSLNNNNLLLSELKGSMASMKQVMEMVLKRKL